MNYIVCVTVNNFPRNVILGSYCIFREPTELNSLSPYRFSLKNIEVGIEIVREA